MGQLAPGTWQARCSLRTRRVPEPDAMAGFGRVRDIFHNPFHINELYTLISFGTDLSKEHGVAGGEHGVRSRDGSADADRSPVDGDGTMGRRGVGEW